MKKSIGLLILFPLLLTSCNIGDFKWANHRTASSSYNYMSDKLRNFNTSFNYQQLEIAEQNLLNVIESKGNANQISLAYTNFYNLNFKLEEILEIVSVYYYGASNDYSEKYSDLYDKINDVSIFEQSLYEKAAKSSDDVKSFFFNTLDDSKIEEILNESETSKASLEITAKMDAISEEFNMYDASLSTYQTEEYFEKGVETYVQYVKLANELAKINGFDNYLEYAYPEVYGRDYSPSDGYDFSQNIKSSLCEVDLKNINCVPQDDGSRDYKNIVNLINLNFNNMASDGAKLFDNYAKFMGKDYVDTYNSLWRDGYYYFSNRDDSLGTAFISFNSNFDYQMAFFSKQKQRILDVVHEFGHYYALHNCRENEFQSYDIMETHSQANEMLFANYVKNNYSNKFAKNFGDIGFYDFVSYFTNFAYIIEVENFAFTTEDLTTEKLVEFTTNLTNEYKKLNIPETYNYWVYPCICCSCYYISYATSSLEAMQFYLLDLEEAKTKYITFCLNTDDRSTKSKWTNAGLLSPFEKESCDLVLNYLKTLQ